MCLVSYVSLGDEAYCISSNRDEFLDRATSSIEYSLINGHKVYFPIDIKGGSWIFTSDNRRSICLLNGALTNHKRILPYRMSRGLIMKAFFQYEDSPKFLHAIDLDNIEPFTMIIREPARLLEFRWNGSLKQIKRLDTTQHYVWSSCTLYEPEMINTRNSWFHELIKQERDLTPEIVKSIHQSGGEGNSDFGFLMNRGDVVKTISLSQIIITADRHELLHKSLMNKGDNLLIQKISVGDIK